MVTASRTARALRLLALALCLVLVSVGVAAAIRLTSAGGIYLAAGEAGAGDSACPVGQEARKGGFYGDLRPGAVEVTGFKMRGRGWRVLGTNTGTEKGALTVESYCSRAAPHPLAEHGMTVPVPPLDTAAAVVHCDRDETLLSAGFRNSYKVGGPRVIVDGMRRVGIRSLRVSGVNLSARSTGTVTAYAYCGHAKRPLVRSQTQMVPPLGKVRLVAKCPEKAGGFGHRPELFGGFGASSSDPATGAVVSVGQFRSFGDRGIVTAINRSADEAIEATVYVYCR
ncbi:MAG TPA: hypothetical protein VFX35_03495 [Solirubrobacterales bacterium]|nr:hypothetical protein [Solirubrobacterales bacterium]